MDAQEQRSGPLADVRVIDLTMFLAGPYCTRLMADMGAEVIKIEPPAGDFLRHSPPRKAGHSRYFGQLNCGKKSVQLDLKSDQGHAQLLELVSAADVLLENFRPGVMARLGLGYEDVRKHKADIVYCSVSGYGQQGADANRPAFAPIIHAASGHDLAQFDYAQGALEKPLRNRSTSADVLAATHAFGAISAALYRRQLSGLGDYIDVSLIDCMHNMLALELQMAQYDGSDKPVVFSPLRAADGFIMVAPVSRANFESLARAVEKPEWLEDPRFADPGKRIENFDILLAEAELWCLDRSVDVCERTIQAAGCPCTRYYTVGESLARRRQTVTDAAVEISDEGGRYLVANTPFKFASARVGAKPSVPTLGEHTAEVLAALNPET